MMESIKNVALSDFLPSRFRFCCGPLVCTSCTRKFPEQTNMAHDHMQENCHMNTEMESRRGEIKLGEETLNL